MSDPSDEHGPELPPTVRHLLFYDGDCALCSRTVRLVARFDREGHFGFAPLGGETARALADQLGGFGEDFDSLVLLEDVGPESEWSRRSRAVLRTLWRLGPPWSVVGLLAFLPRWPFDALYRLVARVRYRVFGRLEACPMPPAEARERFLA